MEVEQLLSLSGSALAQAVSSLLETPGLYVFSDILELPNVREVNIFLHFVSTLPFSILSREVIKTIFLDLSLIFVFAVYTLGDLFS